jgi:hypothetical protein
MTAFRSLQSLCAHSPDEALRSLDTSTGLAIETAGRVAGGRSDAFPYPCIQVPDFWPGKIRTVTPDVAGSVIDFGRIVARVRQDAA